jgi:hypothetical protein
MTSPRQAEASPTLEYFSVNRILALEIQLQTKALIIHL